MPFPNGAPGSESLILLIHYGSKVRLSFGPQPLVVCKMRGTRISQWEEDL
jgi:hypothetical protein